MCKDAELIGNRMRGQACTKLNMCVKQKTIPGDVLPDCGELGGAGQPLLQRGGERGEKHYVGTISVK